MSERAPARSMNRADYYALTAAVLLAHAEGKNDGSGRALEPRNEGDPVELAPEVIDLYLAVREAIAQLPPDAAPEALIATANKAAEDVAQAYELLRADTGGVSQ